MFRDTLKDVYFDEGKIVETLPKLEKAAKSKELKAAFAKHLSETKVGEIVTAVREWSGEVWAG